MKSFLIALFLPLSLTFALRLPSHSTSSHSASSPSASSPWDSSPWDSSPLASSPLASSPLASSPSASSPSDEDTIQQECNTMYPVQRDPVTAIEDAIFQGIQLNVTHEEKCYVNCYLQKSNEIDENNNYRIPDLVNQLKNTKFAKYINVFIGKAYQMKRMYKGVEDKCEKAFLALFGMTNEIVELVFADVLNDVIGTQAFNHTVNNNKRKIDPQIYKKIENMLILTDGSKTS